MPADPTTVYNSIKPNWGGIAPSLASITSYVAGQQQKVQDLQLQQAQDLSKFKTLDQVYYGGAHGQQLDSLLSQNPYGKHLVSNQPSSMSNAGQSGPMSGNPSVGATMIGLPGMSNITGGSMLPNPQQPSPSPAGGASMSPNNPVNAPLVTGGSVTEKAFEPPSMTQSFANPVSEGAVQGAKTFQGDIASEMAGAQAGTAKDNQQLAMIANALKPLAQSYDKVYSSKVGGVLPAGGDVYGSSIVKNLDWVPRGIQSSIVNPDTQQAAGQFLANKNELVTKLQPLLSQQFGKDGSSRIMESLLHMSQNELGDLNTPRDQFKGQLTGTISSLYRIAKAAQAYKQDLQTSGAANPDPDMAAQEIFKRMQLQTMGPAEKKELQGLVDDTLGNNPAPKTASGSSGSWQGGSMNPVGGKQENRPLTAQTAQQLLQAAGGDKDKARQLARNQGYSF